MCFGMQDSKKTTTSYTPNSSVAGAATQNLNFAQNLQTQGFTPYSGNQVANFSPLQQSSFDQAQQMINGGVQYVPQAEGMINNYASAPASSVSANSISSQMSPYMNQYVNLALQPQLEAQNQQFAGQNRGADAGATMAGAFGTDAQAAIGKTNLTNQQNIARQGLIGNAYNSAFNTAIGAGAQDVSNNLNAQTTNANLNETALNRQMTGAQGLEGLGTYGLQSGTGLTNLANAAGGQQTAQQQAGLNAAYNQWLMAQQYPFMASQNMNQAVGAGAAAMPAGNTQTTQTPNNSGWALAGALGGMALAPFTGGLSLGLTGASLGGMSGGDSGSSGGKGGGGFF